MTGVTEAAWLGERFVASIGEPSGPGWQPAGTLFGAGLADALTATQAALGASTPAVAGSLLVAGYANRLAGPMLAALHHDRKHVDPSLANVRVRMAAGRIQGIAFAVEPQPVRPGATRLAAEQLFAGNLAVVVDRVHAATRAGSRVLWSNVAITVASTMLALSWASPDRARYLTEAQAFLAHEPRAAGLVTIGTAELDGESWMFNQRRACCLAFRTAVNQARVDPYCGNCCILDADERLARFQTAARRWRDRPVGSAAAALRHPDREAHR